MAVWGTPVAREDDPERAVRAALDLVDAVARIDHAGWERPLEARAAVMTGEAVTTVGASGQGMVSGDLVNWAAGLQAEPNPGRRLVDDATRALTEASIAFEAAGAQALKGSVMPSPPGGPSVSCPAVPERVGPLGSSRRSSVGRASCISSRSPSKPLARSPRPDWSRSWASPASARAGWPGSSTSTSTASPRTSIGTMECRPRTARASPSGRSARWSGSGWDRRDHSPDVPRQRPATSLDDLVRDPTSAAGSPGLAGLLGRARPRPNGRISSPPGGRSSNG